MRGPVDPVSGWVLDFGDIKKAFVPLHEQLDHHYLNEIDGLQNPTSEHLARWLYDRVHSALPALVAVTVYETHDARCIYRGE